MEEAQQPVSLPDGSEILPLGKAITNEACQHDTMLPDWTDQMGEMVAATCAGCNWGTWIKVSSL